MAMTCKSEMKLLSHEEFETVRATHHPEIYQFDLKALLAVQSRLRSERAKLRTLVNRTARVQKGKPDARADNAPPNGEHLQKRKQVFAKALKRVNKEVKRLRKSEANAKHMDAAHRALATRRSKFAAPPAGDRTASDGMQSNPSTRRHKTLSRSKIGSVSQATKVAQAVRDARPAASRAS